MQDFFEGKKTYISAALLTLMAILPDIQELMAVSDPTTFNFWFPLAKIAVGAATMFFKHIGVKREVEKAVAEVENLQHV